ncbi:MAG: hypothetical protein INF75_06410 [Roseomonas sp.]|nr:hypothetical protein [Roseomonas sp.]MCA3326840.1 hypothetical protein [Roseomonas sp.]MCA3331713.1 hypothetical protein [Roseomonas sp.]MCA3333290.1 hypothetical protein [Roseomonas sp.]MCA3345587.1 hypothetical protein [Roseomonas sp.]
MLTDVFFRRYASRPMFQNVGQKESAFFVQAFRIINEQIWRYYGSNGEVDKNTKAIWTDIHDRLSMEIGIRELSSRYFLNETQWMGKTEKKWTEFPMNRIVENWLNAQFTDDLDADMFVKRRLSFVELAFRKREEQVAQANADLPDRLLQAKRFDSPGAGRFNLFSPDAVRAAQEDMNRVFLENMHELNERLKQAGMPLHYHNGYLQVAQDEQIQNQIEQPFWNLVKDSIWKNVSTSMANAIDLRDNGAPDPSLHAAKALESTIKIICEIKGWVSGNEKGISDFLNHLENKANGPFIENWERKILNVFCSEVRNPLSHGPGSKEMPKFSSEQVDYTIEFCMSWIKSLITRLNKSGGINLRSCNEI